MIDLKKFLDIPVEYKTKPFWSLNDKLDEAKLVDQIDMMAEQGMGGFFVHPRGGLVDQYLGKEFFCYVDIIIKKAEELGLEVWLYDEDRFPSGIAGGKTVKDHKEYGAMELKIHKVEANEYEPSMNLERIYQKQKGAIKDITYLSLNEINRLDSKIYVITISYCDDMERFDNLPYVDVGNKEAIDYFIEVTHEQYKYHFNDSFNQSIKGIFTDEPSYYAKTKPGDRYTRLPWTKDLEKQFFEVNGYFLQDHLHKLFFEHDDYQKVRFDYWNLITSRFVEAFSKNIYHWCEKNQLQYTGHFWEHVFPNPVLSGAVMPHYEFMHIPGIDMLFNYEKESLKDQVGRDFIVKEAVSVANQLDKKRIISETFGASGWELDFRSQKRIVDWLFALGVNFICQHLTHYSLRGYRKRDFPQSFRNHQPWWNEYHYMADYIARVSYCLSQGDPMGDVLALHPSTSTWIKFNGKVEETNYIRESVDQLCTNLNTIHYYYDLGDETIMENHGLVEGATLRIKKKKYVTIILPHLTCIKGNTFEILKKFILAGGHVLCVGPIPNLVDGEESIELETLLQEKASSISNSTKDIESYLHNWGNQRLNLVEVNKKDTTNLYVQERTEGQKRTLFLCNFDQEEIFQIQIPVERSWRVTKLDAFHGTYHELELCELKEKFYIELAINPYESELLMFCDEPSSLHQYETSKLKHSILLKELSIDRMDYNAITIKTCRYRIDNGNWSEEMDTLLADESITLTLNQYKKNIFGLQPYMYPTNNQGKVEASYFFKIEKFEVQYQELYVAIEDGDKVTVKINGIRIQSNLDYYIDEAFVLYDISDKVQLGVNVITLTYDNYDNHRMIENIYVVGDFKLELREKKFVIKQEAGIKLGDITTQGYPYYCGSISYKTNYLKNNNEINETTKIGLPKFAGAVAKVLINDEEAGILISEFDRLDITSYLNKDNNQIEVRIMGTLQNLLGWHNSEEVVGIATPESFYLGTGDQRFESIGLYEGILIETYNETRI